VQIKRAEEEAAINEGELVRAKDAAAAAALSANEAGQ
jgi:hypothetical protein